MHKRELREERNRQDELRRKKTIKRNWILMVVTLGLAIFFFFYFDGFTAGMN